MVDHAATSSKQGKYVQHATSVQQTQDTVSMLALNHGYQVEELLLEVL